MTTREPTMSMAVPAMLGGLVVRSISLTAAVGLGALLFAALLAQSF